ncbi:hypothetical protein PQX77_018448 [Marasmius sp. AFHP31]|nr:hypothetical protein PQX77_018448 [Marasmius sp. AFHP31]
MLERRLDSPSPEFLNNTIGALEAGGMIACLLLGIVTIQVYYYYSKYPKDHVGLKILVAFVWICELGHSICISHSIYVMTVVFWSDPRVFDSPPKTLLTAALFSSLSIPLMQSFFGWRIKGVTGSWTLTLMCWTMSITRMAMLLIAFVEGIKLTSLQQYIEDWGWSILASLVIGTATDVLITLSLIWVLTQKRGTTVSKSTIAVIDTLILWTLETGLLTRYVSATIGVSESSKSTLFYRQYGGSAYDDPGKYSAFGGDIVNPGIFKVFDHAPQFSLVGRVHIFDQTVFELADGFVSASADFLDSKE